jgi:hypothetical protein
VTTADVVHDGHTSLVSAPTGELAPAARRPKPSIRWRSRRDIVWDIM